jgi:hypothetical protein
MRPKFQRQRRGNPLVSGRRGGAPRRCRCAAWCPTAAGGRAYIGSGLQLFVGGTVIVWLPSYLNRYYAMATDAAGAVAAMIVLVARPGHDRVRHGQSTACAGTVPARKFSLAIAYSLGSCVLLSLAFALPHGTPQLVMIGLGMFLAAGTSGPAGAMVANLTPLPIHGTAFAMLTLVNNLLGLAAGPLSPACSPTHWAWRMRSRWVPLISVGARPRCSISPSAITWPTSSRWDGTNAATASARKCRRERSVARERNRGAGAHD